MSQDPAYADGMLRLLASCMLLLAGCNEHQAKSAALPSGCRMATVADVSQIQIYVDGKDVSEVVGRERTGEIGEPLDPLREGLTVSKPVAQLRLSQDARGGNRECLAFGWKVVPVGPDPVAAADFAGRLPSGIVVVHKDDPTTHDAYIDVRAVDDHVTEPNEHFRVELTDASGSTIWGRANPNHSNVATPGDNNAKTAVFTIHDTERDCARPGEGSGYLPSIQERAGTYHLVIQEPAHPRQCAYITWRYLDDTFPTDGDEPDATVLQGMAYFSSDEDTAALGGFQQWFDLGISSDKANSGQSVRIIFGTTSDRPEILTFKLPQRRGV